MIVFLKSFDLSPSRLFPPLKSLWSLQETSRFYLKNRVSSPQIPTLPPKKPLIFPLRTPQFLSINPHFTLSHEPVLLHFSKRTHQNLFFKTLFYYKKFSEKASFVKKKKQLFPAHEKTPNKHFSLLGNPHFLQIPFFPPKTAAKLTFLIPFSPGPPIFFLTTRHFLPKVHFPPSEPKGWGVSTQINWGVWSPWNGGWV